MHNEIRCTQCDHQFSWEGNVVDKPVCPNCGYREITTELAKIQANMDNVRSWREQHNTTLPSV